MYKTLDDLERDQNNIETPNKGKKRLKWSLIFLWILLSLGWVWAWLTKTWIIPNWFWIEVLCSCVDCQWMLFNEWDFPQINWKECCEWTYNRKNGNDYSNGDTKWANPTFDKIPSGELKLKPIIYIYPTSETEVNVKLWTPENLSHTYPKYNSEKWRNVVAQPNGDLEDMDTWRKLYALYREWKSDIKTNFDEWFVVEWKDIIPFLEEKLAILWLNERESEEFIVYRLPQMEDNKYNLIRFETKAEQDENMPLNITPKPDTVIRVMMDWKAIDDPIDIPQQHLTTPERNGFTVVEWWGSPRN